MVEFFCAPEWEDRLLLCRVDATPAFCGVALLLSGRVLVLSDALRAVAGDEVGVLPAAALEVWASPGVAASAEVLASAVAPSADVLESAVASSVPWLAASGAVGLAVELEEGVEFA